jgi:hypothetical protein
MLAFRKSLGTLLELIRRMLLQYYHHIAPNVFKWFSMRSFQGDFSFENFQESHEDKACKYRWLVTRAFAIRFFAYPRFYFSIMRGISILSAAMIGAAVKAHWVARAFLLARPGVLTPGTTNKGLSWCITQKVHGYVIRFPFYTFSIYAVVRRNATPAYNESHLYDEVPTPVFISWSKIFSSKVLCGKTHCHGVKSTCTAKI